MHRMMRENERIVDILLDDIIHDLLVEEYCSECLIYVVCVIRNQSHISLLEIISDI